MKETGQKKQLAGYDTHEVMITITVREKGKTLEEAGGVVMTTDSWLGPQIAALKELTDFDMKVLETAPGSEVARDSAEQLAAAMAMYPMTEAGDGADAEGSAKAPGHHARVHHDVEGVTSKEAAAQQQQLVTVAEIGRRTGRPDRAQDGQEG